MTPADWLSSEDPKELLRFAAPRVPREHLSLVLAELAEATVYYWYVQYPGDWRPAWAVATLRAWCFGHASDEELRRARDAVLAAVELPDTDSLADQAARAAASCVVSCASVPLQRAMNKVGQRVDHDSMGLPELVARAAHSASLATQHGFDGQVASYRASHAHLAGLVRRLISFPSRSNLEWEATAGVAFAGEVMLRLDGRKIGDVVRREDFGRLSAERAVAFDAAQQGAERPLPSDDRAELRRGPSGCVMSPIFVDGQQVGTRISCYGHEEAPPVAVVQAPAQIEKDDSASDYWGRIVTVID